MDTFLFIIDILIEHEVFEKISKQQKSEKNEGKINKKYLIPEL